MECRFSGSTQPPRDLNADWLRRDARQAPLYPNIITTRQHQPSRLFDLDSSRNLRFIPTIDINRVEPYNTSQPLHPKVRRHGFYKVSRFPPSRHFSCLFSHLLSSRDYSRLQTLHKLYQFQTVLPLQFFKLQSTVPQGSSLQILHHPNPLFAAHHQRLTPLASASLNMGMCMICLIFPCFTVTDKPSTQSINSTTSSLLQGRVSTSSSLAVEPK